MKTAALIPLALRAVRRRLLLLGAFGIVLIGAAASARLLSRGADHVELDPIFELGGATLASAYLLFGWIAGRFPLIATIVLLAGIFSDDRASGLARLYRARPVSPIAVYGTRFGTLAACAFAISIVLLPVFDIILVGQWAGPSTFVLAAAYIIAYGGLIALLSVWTRADAWIGVLFVMLAISWHGMRSAGLLDVVPAGGREFVTLILPPHGALLAIESAFGRLDPVPWNAFADVCLYGISMLLLAGALLSRREI